MKKEILKFIQNTERKYPSFTREEVSPSYENKSSRFFNSKKNKLSSNYEKLQKQKILFDPFFEKYQIKLYEILEIPKNLTIGVLGILEMNQTYSREAIATDNLTNLIGVNKFQKNDSEGYIMQNNRNISEIFLKDKTGKIELIIDENKVNWLTTESNIKNQKLKRSMLINGAIVGVLGETKDYHKFIVETLVFWGIQSRFLQNDKNGEHFERNMSNALLPRFNSYKEGRLIEDSSFILLISGFELNDRKPFRQYYLLMEFIKNSLFSERIERIILMGSIFENFECLQTALQSATKNKELYDKAFKQVQANFEIFEKFLSSIISTRKTSIDLMPGPNDSQSPFMPQMNVANLNFLNESNNNCLNFVSNPYFFNFKGLNILGTSGQNLKELKRYCDYSFEENIDLMEYLCYWGNLCPKNSGGFEFQEQFDMDKNFEDFAQIFFTGNSEKFDSRNFYEDNNQSICKLITVPQFCQSHSCVLLNIENFECFEIDFNSK